jgi:glucose/arabinose dehydrogenase
MDMVFVTKLANASEYSGDAIVALHGSWAAPLDGSGKEIKALRRPPKLVIVRFRDGQPGQVEDLVTGFQSVNSGSRWARPVGVAVGPDGDIYFTSDDGAQGLYRLKKLHLSD